MYIDEYKWPVLREISCSDKENKTWLTAWDQSDYTQFSPNQNKIK
jgi:hypothetical protein